MMQRDIDNIHGDEPELDAEWDDMRAEYYEAHADDWKYDIIN